MPADNEGQERLADVATTQVDGLTQRVDAHVSSSRCLPFPAGPVVPRFLTRNGSPVCSSEYVAADRRKKVANLLSSQAGLIGDALSSKGSKNAFTPLLANGVAEWLTRHDDDELLGDPDIEGPLTVESLLNGIFGSADYGAAAEVFAERIKNSFRLAERTRSDKRKANPESEVVALPMGYAAPAYGCACHRAACDGSSYEQISPRYSGQVEELLLTPDGLWVLLSAFFVKQVHGHLAFPATAHTHSSSQRSLYEPLRGLVTGAAMPGMALSTVAAGLLLVPIEPHWKIVGKPAAKLPPNLPSCFHAETLEPCADALRSCRSFLSVHDGLDELVTDVDLLAREMASLLTDYLSADLAGLTNNTYSSLRSRLQEQGKDLLHFEGKVASGASWLLVTSGFEAPLDWDFQLLTISRQSRLLSYFGWMEGRSKYGRTAKPPSATLTVTRPGLQVVAAPEE